MSKNPESNKLDMNFSDQYFPEKALPGKELYFQWIKISLLVILYIIIAVLIISDIPTGYMRGVLSQFQVMIAVYLTVRFKKSGYTIALLLNALQVLASTIGFFAFASLDAATGIFVCSCTIITLSIILSFENRLDKKIQEVSIKNANLAVLNENIASAHQEVEQQNQLLLTYNRIIKENEKT